MEALAPSEHKEDVCVVEAPGGSGNRRGGPLQRVALPGCGVLFQSLSQMRFWK